MACLVGRSQKLRQPRVGRRIIELTLEVDRALGEPVPGAVGNFAAAELAQAGTEVATERLVVLILSRNADHGEFIRQ